MKEVVATIRKSETAQVRVSRSSWRGRQTVDVRVWFIPKGGGEFVPSRKGVTMDVGKCAELIDALQAAQEESGECERSVCPPPVD